jgi:biopolymer transport protein ExbD
MAEVPQPPPPPEAFPEEAADGSFVRPRHREDAEMDITPMIDIVFLLLIFFLVASKMDESAAVRLPPARHGGAVAEDNSIVVIITKGQGENFVVARRDGRAFSGDLEQQEDEIAAYVEAGLSGTQPFDRPMQHIIVKAERQVKEREVARVAEAIGKVTELPTLHYAVLDTQ